MNDIVFNRGRGGLGRALAGKDHVSGIVLEAADVNIPALLKGDNAYQVLFSLQDADDLEITYSAAQDNLEIDALRYALERVYDANPKAEIHLYVANTTATTPLSPVLAPEGLVTLQNEAMGEVRQALILKPGADFAVSDLTAIQASCDTLESQHKPLSVIYSANLFGLAAAVFGDLRALDNKNVSVVAGMDGNGKGAALAEAYSKSFDCGGTALGTLSAAKVNQNIAWVGSFNVNKNDSNEYDVLKLSDGRYMSALSQSEMDSLATKGYIFLIKHIGVSGSFFNDSYTAISSSDDFAYIENNRTIDKAVRNTRTFLLPKLNSPLFVNEDGTLTEDTIAEFKNDAESALEDMLVNNEISSFSVTINPAQDVLSSSKISLEIKVVPVGVARNIVVNIGLAVRISN